MDDALIYSPGTLPVITAVAEEQGIVEVFNEHLDRDKPSVPCLLATASSPFSGTC